MTLCTLVSGGDAQRREDAIAAAIDPLVTTAVILEGVHAGPAPLSVKEKFSRVQVAIIAPDCPCCGAGLVMRVSLDRMLRRHPAHLYISLADAAHLDHFRDYLGAPPYAALVTLAPELVLPAMTANAVDQSGLNLL